MRTLLGWSGAANGEQRRRSMARLDFISMKYILHGLNYEKPSRTFSRRIRIRSSSRYGQTQRSEKYSRNAVMPLNGSAYICGASGTRSDGFPRAACSSSPVPTCTKTGLKSRSSHMVGADSLGLLIIASYQEMLPAAGPVRYSMRL